MNFSTFFLLYCTDKLYFFLMNIWLFYYFRYWTTGSSPSSSSSSGLLSSGESENSRMAIINSIASSYGNYGQSRSRLLSTPTPFSRLANSQENRSKQEAALYKSADALVEAQKAQIYEDIQRRIANVTSSNLNRRLWRNNSTIINNRERQHKLRMKHHRYSIKGKRNRGSESLFFYHKLHFEFIINYFV